MLVHAKLGPLQGDRRVVVWNPIRDKEPEQAAEDYLARIQSSKCPDVMMPLNVTDQVKDEACEKQRLRPLVASCSLVERRDMGVTVWLLFQCAQKAHQDVLADVGITVRKWGSAWALEHYERIY
jgi:hypothetical protein